MDIAIADWWAQPAQFTAPWVKVYKLESGVCTHGVRVVAGGRWELQTVAGRVERTVP
jgi:hypothetical protein